MGVRVTNLTQARISLADPLNYILKSREVRDFAFVEYDLVLNTQSIVDLISKRVVLVANLDAGSGDYDSLWSGPNRFRLGAYHLWVDATNALRMKNGDAAFDLDGFVVGPGGLAAHGATHVFNGVDPIPNIETLEDQWTTLPGAVSVGDLVYATGANTCDRASSAGIATMPVIGVVQTVVDPVTVIVARAGDVSGFVGLTPDAPYFAGLLPGQMALTAPVGPGQVVQKIGYAKNATTIVIALGEHTIRA